MPFDIKKYTETDAATIVLSFGSAGTDKQQQYPNFAATIAKFERIDVFNFDTAFPEDSDEVIGKSKLYLFRQKIDEALQETLNKFIKNAIEAGKKVIILENRAPKLDKFIVELGKQYSEKIGTQIEFIGSYFQDTPVFKYNKNLFQLSDVTVINQTILKAWRNWRERHEPSLKEQQYNVFSTKLLQAWRDQFKLMGTLYRNLKSIPQEELLSPDATQKPIIGLSSEEYKTFLEKRIEALETPLEIASELLKRGEIERFKQYVETNLEVLKKANEYGRSLAHIAVIYNFLDDPSIISFLNSKGFDFSVRDKNNHSPLMFTAWNAGNEVAKALISLGVDKYLSYKELQTIHNNAKEFGQDEVAQTIVKIIKEREEENKLQLLEMRWRIVKESIKEGKIEKAIKILEASPELLTKKDKSGRTIAHYAVIENEKDDPSLIEYLIRKPVDLSQPDQTGLTPLDFTAWNAGIKTLNLLLPHFKDQLTLDKLEDLEKNTREKNRLEIANLFAEYAETLKRKPSRN